MGTTVPAREVGPLRLAAQRLVGPAEATPGDATRRLLAVQAQDLPGALRSLALRTACRGRAQVAAALDDGSLVRSWPMRGTLHLVAAEDLHWMLDLLGRRALTGVAKRWVHLGLDEAQAERARELATGALAGGRRASRAELLSAIAAGGVATTGQRGYHLVWYLAQTGTLCLGPTDGAGDQRVVLLDEWVRSPRRPDREEAVAELALRFFGGHGPATPADLVRWAGTTVRDVRAGLAAAGDRLERVEVDGVEHWMDPATPQRLAQAREQADGVLLLPGFDEFVLGYGDRTAVLPAQFADRIVPGRNGVFRPTVVAGGAIVGTWRWTGTGSRRRVEHEAFGPLPAGVAGAIRALAAALPTGAVP